MSRRASQSARVSEMDIQHQEYDRIINESIFVESSWDFMGPYHGGWTRTRRDAEPPQIEEEQHKSWPFLEESHHPNRSVGSSSAGRGAESTKIALFGPAATENGHRCSKWL